MIYILDLVLELIFLDSLKKSLETIYRVYRPTSKYGNIIWDNYTKQESDMIESVKCDADRIVTGMRRCTSCCTSRSKLYSELI